jgi:hypothetical protein
MQLLLLVPDQLPRGGNPLQVMACTRQPMGWPSAAKTQLLLAPD